MFDNNNERPRFDAETGLPIKYEDEPVNSVSEEQVSTIHADQNIERPADENAATEDRSNLFFTNNELDSVSRKAAKKKTKNSNGSKKSFKKIAKMVVASVLCGAIAGATMLGVNQIGTTYFPTSASKSSNVNIATVNTAGSNNNTSNLLTETSSTTTVMDVPNVVKAAMPAVVAISGTVTTSTSSFGYFGGTTQASTSGTGIIIGKNDTELLMVTNAHVVESVNNLKVTFTDNESVSATVKGSKTDKDIAVVAVKISDIKDSTIQSIAIAELGDSDNIQVGESVVAIGNALGEGQSVTVGWVSALNRSITVENTEYKNLIMTDAAINPGNSGGALLNAKGQVVGINSAKYSSEEVEGMGYAIPISSVKDIIDNLMTKETRAKVASSEAGFLGIAGVDITSTISSSYGYPQGIMIQQITSGSAAEKAGLSKNDIIVSFDGDDVKTFDTLKSAMQYYKAGEKVTIGYYHMENGSYVLKQVDVTLGQNTSSN